MADVNESRPTPLGIYERSLPMAVTGTEIAAGIASFLWVGLTVSLLLLGDAPDDEALTLVVRLLAIVLPIGMIWVVATTLRATRALRVETARLQSGIEALRKAYVAQAQQDRPGPDRTIARKLDEIAAAQRKTETTLATFTSSRTTPALATAQIIAEAGKTGDDENQASLALGTPAEALEPPLPNEDFVRALNFPETADDEIGFAALRRALKHRKTAQLVQASQDVLTLLSQDGIYMDDLRPDLARPETWRQFAKGERGRAVAPLGGIRDRSSLALTAGRMKQDPIFRDAAHHFLRVFDKTFATFEPDASDPDLNNFANTRTARAFMLLGRVAGTFD